MREEDTDRNKNTVKNTAEQSSNRLVTDGAGDIKAVTDDELADKLAGVSTAAESALSDYDLAVIGEAVSRLGNDREARDPELATDGGVTIESQFLVEATQLEDVSVSTEQDRFIVTIRGPADGVIDASPVIDLATEHGHTVGPVLADIETPEITVEVER